MIVPAEQTDNRIGPDIPEDVAEHVTGYSRNPDGTYTLRLSEEYREAVREQEARSLKAAARLDVTERLKGEHLDEATIAQVAGIYDPWEPGLAVAEGDVLQWDGTLVEVLQAHTTQADWEPPAVPALFRIYRTDDGSEPIAWQPGLALEVDEEVTHEGTTYRVTQAHTTQAGWEPPNVPALFEAL